jgi:HK97 family phage portal protein
MKLLDVPFYLLGGWPIRRPRLEPSLAPAVVEEPQARLTSPELHPGETRFVFFPSSVGGVRVTEDTAAQVAAVWACAGWIGKMIAASNWAVFLEAADGTRTMRRDRHWRILNVRPNPEVNAFDWRFTALWQCLLYGNHYSEIERDEMGRAHFLWDLDPARVRPDRDEDMNLVYRVFNPSGPETILPARNVFHIKGPGVSSVVGRQVVEVAARIFGSSIASDQFVSSFFNNMLQPGLAVEFESNLTDAQRDQLYKGLEDRLKGKAFGTLISEGGGKVKPIASTPEQSQSIEHRHFLIEEVCRFFGVPPQKAQHLLRMTFNNVEELNIDAVLDALTPWAERLRQEADFKLLPMSNRAVRTRIELDWLTEGNAVSRAQADSALVNGGLYTINERRQRRGDNPSPDKNANKLLVQGAMVPLDQLGEQPEPPDKPEAEDPEAEEEGRRLTVVESQ